MTTFMFPGQGSQKKGMGKELFEQFAELTARADEILGYSIEELCLEDPDKKLNLTQYTQPALFVVSALTYLRKKAEDGVSPNYLAGHSLGEYNALLAAGAFDFETGLKLVQKRGELMSKAGEGVMAAVLQFEGEKIKEALVENGLESVDLANFNCPSQIVISGPKHDISQAQKVLKKAGARCIPLKVTSSFHSRYMQDAKEEFEAFLAGFSFKEPSIPVISNVEARPYGPGKVKELLAGQITHTVNWTDTIRFLLAVGEEVFEEVGPGKVLAGLLKKIKAEAEPLELTQAEKTPREETPRMSGIGAEILGCAEFRRDYKVRLAYASGSMYKGIASKELVVRMGKAGLLSFLGAGGLKLERIEADISHIQSQLGDGRAFGMNLLHDPSHPDLEYQTIDLYLRTGISHVEASAYMQVTPGLAWFRLKGIHRDGDGQIVVPNTVIGKVSRPEVAEAFMSPTPEKILKRLVAEGKLSPEEAELGERVPVASDICVESDSAGHTDMGVMTTLVPVMLMLRGEMMTRFGYPKKIRVGAAGGIGTPEAAAAAFILGVDFIVTGSINQCTVEAGTSERVKDLLQDINVQDTAYAPAGDLFELGAKIQVLKKGLFFPARANKLYLLYQQHNALDEIEPKLKKQIQEKYFKKSFEEVWAETESYYRRTKPDELEKAARFPKHKMAMIFKWYFVHTNRLAISGSRKQTVDYQVHCGPALGAFNQWVKGTPREDWHNRHVDEIGIQLMEATAETLSSRLQQLQGAG